MNIFRYGLILSLFLFSTLIPACGGGANSNTVNTNTAPGANAAINNANSANTSIEELGLLITLPYEAEDVAWRESPIYKDSTNAAPTASMAKKLIAVLRFSAADANKLAAEAAKIKPPEPVKITVETWFPDDLIAQSEMSDDDTLTGTTYAANNFYQPPYSEGKLTRIEGTDYFVLEVFAK